MLIYLLQLIALTAVAQARGKQCKKGTTEEHQEEEEQPVDQADFEKLDATGCIVFIIIFLFL